MLCWIEKKLWTKWANVKILLIYQEEYQQFALLI